MRVTSLLLLSLLSLCLSLRYNSPASKVKLAHNYKRSNLMEISRPEAFSMPTSSDAKTSRLTHAHAVRGASVNKYSWGKAAGTRGFKWNPFSLMQKDTVFKGQMEASLTHKLQAEGTAHKTTTRMNYIQKKMRETGGAVQNQKSRNLAMLQKSQNEKVDTSALFLQQKEKMESGSVIGWLWSKISGSVQAKKSDSVLVDSNAGTVQNKNLALSDSEVQSTKSTTQAKTAQKTQMQKVSPVARAKKIYKDKDQVSSQSQRYQQLKAKKQQGQMQAEKTHSGNHGMLDKHVDPASVKKTRSEWSPNAKKNENEEKNVMNAKTQNSEKKLKSKTNAQSATKSPTVNNADFVPETQPVPNPTEVANCAPTCPARDPSADTSNEESPLEEGSPVVDNPYIEQPEPTLPNAEEPVDPSDPLVTDLQGNDNTDNLQDCGNSAVQVSPQEVLVPDNSEDMAAPLDLDATPCQEADEVPPPVVLEEPAVEESPIPQVEELVADLEEPIPEIEEPVMEEPVVEADEEPVVDEVVEADEEPVIDEVVEEIPQVQEPEPEILDLLPALITEEADEEEADEVQEQVQTIMAAAEPTPPPSLTGTATEDPELEEALEVLEKSPDVVVFEEPAEAEVVEEPAEAEVVEELTVKPEPVLEVVQEPVEEEVVEEAEVVEEVVEEPEEIDEIPVPPKPEPPVIVEEKIVEVAEAEPEVVEEPEVIEEPEIIEEPVKVVEEPYIVESIEEDEVEDHDCKSETAVELVEPEDIKIPEKVETLEPVQNGQFLIQKSQNRGKESGNIKNWGKQAAWDLLYNFGN